MCDFRLERWLAQGRRGQTQRPLERNGPSPPMRETGHDISAGWRRHPMFGVCDLPKGPFLPTALRREYTLLRHALLPPQLDSMHNNPVTRGLVNSPEDWPWSSWRFYYWEDASILRMDRMGEFNF